MLSSVLHPEKALAAIFFTETGTDTVLAVPVYCTSVFPLIIKSEDEVFDPARTSCGGI
jgi:hypothetical protein